MAKCTCMSKNIQRSARIDEVEGIYAQTAHTCGRKRIQIANTEMRATCFCIQTFFFRINVV